MSSVSKQVFRGGILWGTNRVVEGPARFPFSVMSFFILSVFKVREICLRVLVGWLGGPLLPRLVCEVSRSVTQPPILQMDTIPKVLEEKDPQALEEEEEDVQSEVVVEGGEAIHSESAAPGGDNSGANEVGGEDSGPIGQTDVSKEREVAASVEVPAENSKQQTGIDQDTSVVASFYQKFTESRLLDWMTTTQKKMAVGDRKHLLAKAQELYNPATKEAKTVLKSMYTEPDPRGTLVLMQDVLESLCAQDRLLYEYLFAARQDMGLPEKVRGELNKLEKIIGGLSELSIEKGGKVQRVVQKHQAILEPYFQGEELGQAAKMLLECSVYEQTEKMALLYARTQFLYHWFTAQEPLKTLRGEAPLSQLLRFVGVCVSWARGTLYSVPKKYTEAFTNRNKGGYLLKTEFIQNAGANVADYDNTLDDPRARSPWLALHLHKGIDPFCPPSTRWGRVQNSKRLVQSGATWGELKRSLQSEDINSCMANFAIRDPYRDGSLGKVQQMRQKGLQREGCSYPLSGQKDPRSYEVSFQDLERSLQSKKDHFQKGLKKFKQHNLYADLNTLISFLEELIQAAQKERRSKMSLISRWGQSDKTGVLGSKKGPKQADELSLDRYIKMRLLIQVHFLIDSFFESDRYGKSAASMGLSDKLAGRTYLGENDMIMFLKDLCFLSGWCAGECASQTLSTH